MTVNSATLTTALPVADTVTQLTPAVAGHDTLKPCPDALAVKPDAQTVPVPRPAVALMATA